MGGAVDRRDGNRDAVFGKCCKPGRRLRCSIEARQRDQRDVIGVQVQRMALEGGRAFDARLARWNAYVDELPRRKESEIRVGRDKSVPAKMLLDDEDFAFFATGLPRGGANRVRRFDGRQRLVPMDDIERREFLRKMRAEFGMTQLQVTVTPAFSRPATGG